MSERLGLGTAQFGGMYGVAGAGRIPRTEVPRILELAFDLGFDTLDTAAEYGDSEEVLGESCVDRWRTITKLPAIPTGWNDGAQWVLRGISRSLERLRVPRIHGLLLHRPADLLEASGDAIYAGLRACRDHGLARKVGISIYDPRELDALLPRYPMDLVQAPFNVLDRRLHESGWLDRLAASGVEVHVRSVFLQGLLLLPQDRRPPKFERWNPLWRRWEGWLRDNEVSPLRACLHFALSHRSVDRVIAGVDSREQLREIAGSLGGDDPIPPPSLATNDVDLIDPSRWNSL